LKLKHEKLLSNLELCGFNYKLRPCVGALIGDCDAPADDTTR